MKKLITVNDKLVNINNFRDYLELIRTKLGDDSEKYLNDYLELYANSLIEASKYQYTEKDLEDEYNYGYQDGKEERENELNNHIKECISSGMTSLEDYCEEYCYQV